VSDAKRRACGAERSEAEGEASGGKRWAYSSLTSSLTSFDRRFAPPPPSINNLGDPFVPSNYGVHSRQFEVAVIDFFANLWKIDKSDYWGYVTTCGTEGNLHGILLARECHPDGILYSSRETHYR
jgi:hypothetical protein